MSAAFPQEKVISPIRGQGYDLPEGPALLITGGNGFIGSNLIDRLEKDYDVCNLERYVTGRYVLGNDRAVKTVFADLRDYTAVKSAIRDISPDYIIHLAAISAVSYSYEHPHEVIDADFMGTVNLAEAALAGCPNLKQFLFASTSEVYGNNPNVRTEETVVNPNSPYAVAKYASEKYLRYMVDAYSFPATILRPFNTYGRTTNSHFVVERAIVQMLKGGPVRLGDPEPVRDMMYVDDHVNAYTTCLGNKKAIGELFNFCTGRGVTVKKLVEMAAGIAGYKGEIVWDAIPRRPLDIMYLVGDYSKAKSRLGWSTKYKLEEGLKLTVEHWRKKMGG